MNKYLLVCLIVFALFARLWGIGSSEYFFDEYMHVPSASNYVEKGQFWPDLWYHPPLKHIMLYGSMKIFGNNPYGWRMRNIIFGTLSILLMYLLGRELLGGQRTAFMAALFMAIEPMHIFASRIASEEIPGIFFCMAGVYAALLYLRNKKHAIVLSGAAFGLALATKWYFQLTLGCLIAFVFVSLFRKEGLSWQRTVYVLASLIILPAGIYLLSFIPWFQRGYSLPEFIQMQIGAYKTLHTVTMTGFFANSSMPAEWFIKPVVLIRKVSLDWTDYQLYMSNFPVWLLMIPAVLFVISRLRRKFDQSLFLVLLLFASLYLPLLIVNRPILLYSALPLLPFVYLMVAYLVVAVLDKVKAGERSFNAVMIAIAVWGLYLWPLTVRLPVPALLYDPLRLIGKVMIE